MNEAKLSSAMKVMKTIHWTITLMPVLFSLVVLYFNYAGSVGESPELKNVFLYVAVIMLAIAIPVSSIIFKTYLKNNRPQNPNSANQLMGVYQTGHLIRLSVLEVAGLFAVVSAFKTGYMPMLGLTAVSTAIMISLTPSEYKLSEAFGVNIQEMKWD